MNDQKPPVKRSSKEILEELKQLYREKEYVRALELCTELVARHPGNADLEGLFAKIEARVKATAAAAPATPPPTESTVYYTERAESSVSQETPAPTGDAGDYVQQGVKLYEVQDYGNAVKAWETALSIDPENTMAIDYLNNVRAMIGAEHTAENDEDVPDKNQLLTIYNEGLQLYKHKDFTAALEKWEYILKYHPGHKETQECIRKTKAALEKEQEYVDMLNEAESDFRTGDHAEAERKVLHLLIKAPHLEGAQKLKEAIEERKRQITEIRSLEIEETQPQHISSATDDEITRYFTPDAAEGRKAESRKVVKIVKPKKERKVSKWLIAVIVLIPILGVAGWQGWQMYQRQLVLERADVPLQVMLQEEAWDDPERRSEDLVNIGMDYLDEGEFLFAYYAFEQAKNVAEPRLKDLQALPQKDEVVQGQITRLDNVVKQAGSELERLPDRFVAKDVSTDQLKSVDKYVESGDVVRAEEVLSAALTADLNNDSLRIKLADIDERHALSKVKLGELDEAHIYFRRAAVLNKANKTLFKHLRVINMYYDGSITAIDKDQWFFFFTH